ncbi:hypothetical protein AVEN_72736-1 [Araneus ventricosus]|uniref:Uncharacterized protein n=1 Tax=Araneus ventricosus TaxID=182803 RepID=A0A4Y2DNJ2_ARAVE|nr:hypothetical protein AVEN_72736-1 [Araneus ventricosus]
MVPYNSNIDKHHMCLKPVYNDKPAYNDFSLVPGIYSVYFQLANNDNHSLNSPVYNDNFTSLECWYSIKPVSFPWKTTHGQECQMIGKPRGAWKLESVVPSRYGEEGVSGGGSTVLPPGEKP